MPDYILAAYGTNDWFGKEREDFIERCHTFYRNLPRNYPTAQIFAITPSWRKDMEDEKRFGPFRDVDILIRKLPNVTVIPGFDLVPHDENLYCDFRVHPNDRGFAHYFTNLRNYMYCWQNQNGALHCCNAPFTCF